MLKSVSYYDDDGNEVETELPAHFEVCWECEGHGTHLTPSIREHAYTTEEFAESFDDDEAAEYFRRGGRYDVQCHTCNGRRVVLTVDMDACDTAEQKFALERYLKHEHDRAQSEAEDRATYRAESGWQD